MNKQKVILILLLILPLLFVLYLYSPFLIMGLIDSSWYYTEEKVDIGSFDYSSVLTKAEKAGYEVEGWFHLVVKYGPTEIPDSAPAFIFRL